MTLNGFVQPRFSLKDLLESPDLQHPPINKNEGKKGEIFTGLPATSAFLGPNLWSSRNYDGDFNLEYMDLDEFLSENGIPMNLSDDHCSKLGEAKRESQDLSCKEATTKSNYINLEPPLQALPVNTVLPKQSLPVVGNCKDLQLPQRPDYTNRSPLSTEDEASRSSPYQTSDVQGGTPHAQTDDESEKTGNCEVGRVSPILDFDVNPNDLALASIPGQENFDPRKVKFTEEDLKPQPIIKKSRKVFVPEDCKDDKYWMRRTKNNVAAKRSRDARRVKENQIALRAAFLEKENNTLKNELKKVIEENKIIKTKLSQYESVKN